MEQGQKLIRSILPVVALAVIAILAFLFFQKSFAAKTTEEEDVEEVPIEPVTESRELTLAQLGLAQFWRYRESACGGTAAAQDAGTCDFLRSRETGRGRGNYQGVAQWLTPDSISVFRQRKCILIMSEEG